jgi:hypothetical protein
MEKSEINKIGSVRMAHSRNLYLLDYSNSLIPRNSRRALLWRFIVAGSSTTFLGLHVKCPVFLPDFKKIWIRQISIKSPVINFTEIRLVGAVWIPRDRLMDRRSGRN